jgi:hypothetical protein
MKSVMFSEVVYAHGAAPWVSPVRPRRRLLSFALLMVLGLASLVALFHRLDPGAPLALIVVPVLAGGLLPLAALMPARFEVTTRFEARHLLRAIEEGLVERGYARVDTAPGQLRYRPEGRVWMRWPATEIDIAVREHLVGITGPAATLRALRKRLGVQAQVA